MRAVPPIVKATIAAIALVLAVTGAVPSMVAHAASPTVTPTPGRPSSGGPGAAATYNYTWDYSDCQTNSKETNPSGLKIVLAWDDSATTPIGFASVTANKDTFECQGTVTGTVPSNATPGDHFPQAYLEDPARGDEVVPNSNSGKAAPGQQFTVVLPPTATPAPTPSPTPTDTPLSTDTPTLTTPAPTATSASNIAPLATNNTGSSGPSKALLVAIGLIVLIAAATGGTVLVRRRRARAAGSDPFEFLR
jgi:hypothetical protein